MSTCLAPAPRSTVNCARHCAILAAAMTVVLLALSAAAGFGAALVLAQRGLRTMTPLAGACVSIPATAALFLAAAPLALAPVAWSPTGAATFALVGCLFPAAVTLLTFESNRRIGPSVTAALGNLAPLFAVLAAIVLVGEEPRLGQLAGMAVVCAGAALLVGATRSAPTAAWGWAATLPLAAAAIRGGAQAAAKLGLDAWPDPFAAALIGYVVSALVVLGAACAQRRRVAVAAPGRGWPWFCAVGALNGVAVLCLYAALARGPVALVAPLVACYPLVTLALGLALPEGRRLPGTSWFGVAATVLGVALLLAA